MLQLQDRGEVGKPEHPRCSPVFRPEEMEISGATLDSSTASGRPLTSHRASSAGACFRGSRRHFCVKRTAKIPKSTPETSSSFAVK